MLEQLLLRIRDLLKSDEVSFKKKLLDLDVWAEKVICPYSKDFTEAIVLSLKDTKKDLVEAKRLLRKFQKKIRKQIAINDKV